MDPDPTAMALDDAQVPEWADQFTHHTETEHLE
jgi:hypothetical protein